MRHTVREAPRSSLILLSCSTLAGCSFETVRLAGYVAWESDDARVADIRTTKVGDKSHV